MISFAHATAYLTVATILDRDLPLVAEQALLIQLLKKQGGQAVCWKAGRPSDRWGLHPDILFRTGLTGALDEWCAQELFLQATLSSGDADDPLLSLFKSPTRGNAADAKLNERLEKAKNEICAVLNAIKKLLSPPLDRTTRQILLRVQPSGISTLTLTLCLSSPLDDKTISALLPNFDPRRGFSAPGLTCPDLSRLHTALLETLRHERRDALKSALKNSGADVKLYSSQDKLRKHATEEHTLLKALLDEYNYGDKRTENEVTLTAEYHSLLRDGSDNDVILKDILKNIRTAKTEIEDASQCNAKVLLRNLGDECRGKLAWLDGEAKQHVKIPHPPYCTLHLELADFSQFRDKDHQKQLFHLIAGVWSKSPFEIPMRYQRADGSLVSATWDDESIAFVMERGAGLIFAADSEKFWPQGLRNDYVKTAMDVVETTLGKWAALGILNVSADVVIQSLSRDPIRNFDALRSLATIRQIFARLLAERLLYQTEGGSLRAIWEHLSRELRIAAIESTLRNKLEQVEKLHELLLHSSALDQIRRERA